MVKVAATYAQLLIIHVFFYTAAGEIIRIPALARIGNLGGLYNSIKEEIIYGHSAYDGGILNTSIELNPIGDIACKARIVHNYNEKNEITDTTSSTALSIYAGLVAADGSARVHKDFTLKEDRLSAVLSYTFRSFVEAFDVTNDEMKERFKLDSIQYYGATHIITGIEWGARVYCASEIETSSGSNRTELENQLSLEFASAAHNLEGSRQHVSVNSSLFHGSNTYIEFFTDVNLGKSSASSIREMCDVVSKVPNITRDSYNGKGLPLVYILSSIDDVQHFSNSNVSNASLPKNVQFESQLTLYAREQYLRSKEVTSLHNDISVAYQRYAFLFPSKFMETATSLRTKQELLYEDEFLSSLRSITYKVRQQPQLNLTSDLLRVKTWYSEHENGGERSAKIMKRYHRYIKGKIEYFDVLRGTGILFLTQTQTISVVSLLHHTSDLYILIIPYKETIVSKIEEESEESIADPYGAWKNQLLVLTKTKGNRYIADCGVTPYNECKNLLSAKILHFKDSYLISSNFPYANVTAEDKANIKLYEHSKLAKKTEILPKLLG